MREVDAFTSRIKKRVGRRGGSVDIAKVPDTVGLGDIKTSRARERYGEDANYGRRW